MAAADEYKYVPRNVSVNMVSRLYSYLNPNAMVLTTKSKGIRGRSWYWQYCGANV